MPVKTPFNTNFVYQSDPVPTADTLVVQLGANVRDIAVVLTTEAAGTGNVAVNGSVAGSPFIDLSASINSATVAITNITQSGLSALQFVPSITVTAPDAETQADISFTASTKTIASAALADFTIFDDGDQIQITGSGSNDGRYTVVGAPTTLSMVVAEDLVDEVAGATVTITEVYTYTVYIQGTDNW